jgi:hypothetical protein
MPTPDRIVSALDRLDPEDRAHLELSYRRGFSDSEIADLVGADASEVPGLRDEAVAEMADELGEDETAVRSALEEMDEDDWAGRPRAAEEEPALAVSEPATVVSPQRSRRMVVLLIAGAAVLLLALIVALASGGDDDSAPQTAKQSTTKKKGDGTKTQPGETPPPAGGGRPVAFERLNGTYGHGSARILGGAKLRLRVSGFLQPSSGGYAVWLIGPGEKTHRLYVTKDTSINRDLPLPDGYEDFDYVEVARAVPALSSPHSSFSLLRVRLKALAAGGL